MRPLLAGPKALESNSTFTTLWLNKVENGAVAEWSCWRLQLVLRRFDSDPRLHFHTQQITSSRSPIPTLKNASLCPGGGIGRHRGLKIPRPLSVVPVQVRPRAPYNPPRPYNPPSKSKQVQNPPKTPYKSAFCKISSPKKSNSIHWEPVIPGAIFGAFSVQLT